MRFEVPLAEAIDLYHLRVSELSRDNFMHRTKYTSKAKAIALADQQARVRLISFGLLLLPILVLLLISP